MSLLSSVTSSRKPKPRRTVVYGTHGIGKSTFASMWPSPVFVPTEDGISDLDVPAFPLCQTVSDAWGAIIALAGDGPHDYKTVVVDSADWLEQLIWKQVCEKRGVKSITDIDFGKGYGEAATIFRSILGALDGCRAAGMHVVILSHARAVKVEPPGQQAYTRYEPKLQKSTGNGPSASEILQEWCDELLFCNYRVDVRNEDAGFNRERGIAAGKGERVIFTQEGPAHLAKNRLRLPPELPLDFRAYAPYLNPQPLAAATE